MHVMRVVSDYNDNEDTRTRLTILCRVLQDDDKDDDDDNEEDDGQDAAPLVVAPPLYVGAGVEHWRAGGASGGGQDEVAVRLIPLDTGVVPELPAPVSTHHSYLSLFALRVSMSVVCACVHVCVCVFVFDFA